MPSYDDPSGFPPSRRGRAPRAARAGRDRTAQDWRYPDPVERYGQDYEDFAAQPVQDRDSDEWQTTPGSGDQVPPFDTPQRREAFRDDRGWDRAAPGWDDQDAADDPLASDPFDWDAPEPPAEPGWRDDGWDQDEQTGAGPGRHTDLQPQGQRRRDDSLFRRIDGSAQDPDLAAFSGRGEADRYDGGPAADPSALGNRFFSGAEDDAEPYDDDREAPSSGNVFQFDPHRGRQPGPDDPYAWDDGYDAPPPLPGERYAADRGHYDGYDPDGELHPEDDLDADFLDDEAEAAGAPVPERRSRRKLMVAGVLVAAVATGGGAAFVYKSYQDGSLANFEAPTLLADSGPVKGEPSDPGGKEFPDGNKQIYDRLSGKPAKAAADQAQTDRGESASIPGIVTTGAEAPADTLDERIAAALRRSGSPAGETTGTTSADPDSPRSVRTLTIRPDGSVAPAATPSPSQPGEAETVTTAGIVATTGTGSRETASAEPASETQETAAAEAPAPRPERAAPRPQETRVASAEPATAASTQPATTVANPYFVQLAARRDQTSALAAFADLQQKYPSILNGLAPTIKKADLGDKGVWYRLWVGPMDTRGNAQDVCGKLKNAGLGGCFVRTE